MNPVDFLRELLNAFAQKRRYKDREIKRIFQWRRYLEWKELTYEEKLLAKRLLLLPIAAYFLFVFLEQYALTLIFLTCLYLAYKKFQKGNLMK